MKVAHVIDHLGSGGAQQVLFDLVSNLPKAGFEPLVISLRGDTPLASKLRALGCHVETLGMSKFSFSAIRTLRLAMHRFKPAIVHTHLNFSNAFAARAALAEGVPVVIRHDHSGRAGDNWHYRLTRSLAERLAGPRTHILAVSKDAADFNISLGVDPARLTVINNGVDLAAGSSQPATLPELNVDGGRPPIVGFVGRLCGYKGLDYLIAAAAVVLKSVPAVKFVIIGDGPARKDISIRIAKRGFSEAFILLGHRPDARRWYNAFDVTVVPSLYEAFGLSVIESMAAATPVVAFRVGGIPEIIEDQVDGFLTAPGDVEGFAQRVISLLIDPGLAARVGTAARKKIERHYEIQSAMTKVVLLYERLLAQAGIESAPTAAKSENDVGIYSG